MKRNYKFETLRCNILHLQRSIEALENSTFFDVKEKSILLEIYTARLENYKNQISILEATSL